MNGKQFNKQNKFVYDKHYWFMKINIISQLAVLMWLHMCGPITNTVPDRNKYS